MSASLIDTIRNFSIIAHIDHGKSTLADRLLLQTGAISPREFRDQILDDMDLERERGITIKARAVMIRHRGYRLNLIDTPGHVDFTYEVSKSLSACEGALLLVDASQGIEAQTVGNMHLAQRQKLTIVPVVSKIDLPQSEPDRVAQQMEDTFAIDRSDIIFTSAKEDKGIVQVLDGIIDRVPRPTGDPDASLRALIFDSKYDSYKGVVVYVRLFDGKIRKGLRIQMVASGTVHEVEEVGIFTPRSTPVDELSAGEVGYVCANLKQIRDVRVGDTLTEAERPTASPLAGYQEVLPLVFSGFYPINPKDFVLMREAMEKLQLNDPSFSFEPETSGSLGFGFRCGFLGLLHMDIIQERLEREFDIQLIVTAPNVACRVTLLNLSALKIDNPSKLPPPNQIEKVEEPFLKATIICPADSVGVVMALAQERRGIYLQTEYLDERRAMLTYELPLAEVVLDFNDRIKSVTRGYGSFNYEVIGYRPTELVRLDILVNGEICDGLSILIHKDKAYHRGREIVGKLKDNIPRQLFEVALQAAIGSRVIARETVKPVGKNVTGKCYGGDITRKRKLWEKQKEGKKRMKQFGKVQIPQEAFLSILEVD